MNKTILFSSVALLISGCSTARDNNLPGTSVAVETQASEVAETAETLSTLTAVTSVATCPKLAEYYVCGEQVEGEESVSVDVEIKEDRNENEFFVDNGIDPENSDVENLASEIIYDNEDGLSLDGSVQDRSFTQRDDEVALAYSASCGSDSVTTHFITDSSALKTTYTKVDDENIEVKSYSLDEDGQVTESSLNCVKAERPVSSLLGLGFWGL